MNKYIFPIVMILLNLSQAVVCMVEGDVKKTIYWIAAATLNACVAF